MHPRKLGWFGGLGKAVSAIDPNVGVSIIRVAASGAPAKAGVYAVRREESAKMAYLAENG